MHFSCWRYFCDGNFGTHDTSWVSVISLFPDLMIISAQFAVVKITSKNKSSAFDAAVINENVIFGLNFKDVWQPCAKFAHWTPRDLNDRQLMSSMDRDDTSTHAQILHYGEERMWLGLNATTQLWHPRIAAVEQSWSNIDICLLIDGEPRKWRNSPKATNNNKRTRLEKMLELRQEFELTGGEIFLNGNFGGDLKEKQHKADFVVVGRIIAKV